MPSPASGLAGARRRDAADPLGAVRERFHIPDGPDGPAIYLCGNSLGLQPVAAAARVEEEMDAWRRLAVRGHFEAATPWFGYHEVLREPGARLVGAQPDEVVFMNSLTTNLHLCLATFYRPTTDRHVILIGEPSFPSDRYAVASRIALSGFDPSTSLEVVGPPPGADLTPTEAWLEALDRGGSRIALVLVEGVGFLTGQRHDLAAIGAAARKAGAVFGVDLAHAVGNVPLALHDDGVDFAVWCNYKYVGGGPGTVGGCFVNERHGSDLSLPRMAGWWGNDPATRFRMQLEPEFVPRPGADGWQLSNPPILAMAPLRAALEVFDEVGIDALRERSLRLTGYLEELLAAIGREHFGLVTPSDPEARGCQLSIRVARDGRGLQERLEARGVVCDFREPDILRVAPVPLYNSFEEVRIFAGVLAEQVGVDLDRD